MSAEATVEWAVERKSPRRVVIAYGGRGGSEDALCLGAWLARSTGDRAVVVTVYPKEPLTVLPGIGKDWVKSMRENAQTEQNQAREAIRRFEMVATRPDFRVVGAASAAAGLDLVADRLEAAVIVVGSSGRGIHRRVSNNHTSNRLLQGASAPVLITPRGFAATPPSSRLRRVGCAFLPTREGKHALRQAAKLARRADAQLEVFTVVAPGAEQPRSDPKDWRRFIEKTRGAMAATVEQVVGELPDGLEHAVHILDGDPVTALAALDSTDCDLLVCGSRGYGPVKRVLLGGVSDRLVRRAAAPVMVVPRSAR